MAGCLVTAFRTASMYLTLMRQQCDWDKCTEIDDGLFISAMPIKEAPCGRRPQYTNDLPELVEFVLSKKSKRPLRHILSVVERDEQRGDGFLGVKTVSDADLEKYNSENFKDKKDVIERHLLSMRDYDFSAEVSLEMAAKALQKIDQVRQAGGAALVHCKAGCERSAMICLAYLVCYVINPNTEKKYTVDEALEMMRSKRKQVTVAGEKLLQAKRIIEYVTKKPAIENPAPRSCRRSVSDFWYQHKNTVVAAGLSIGAAVFTAYRLG